MVPAENNRILHTHQQLLLCLLKLLVPGVVNRAAKNLGIAKYLIGSIAIISRASICSVTFIVPAQRLLRHQLCLQLQFRLEQV